MSGNGFALSPDEARQLLGQIEDGHQRVQQILNHINDTNQTMLGSDLQGTFSHNYGNVAQQHSEDTVQILQKLAHTVETSKNHIHNNISADSGQ